MKRVLIVVLLLCWGSAAAFGDAAEMSFDRGRVWLDKGEPKLAVASFDHAIAIRPTYARAFGWRGMARLQLGLRKQALADFQKAVSLDPDDALLYEMRAEGQVALGDTHLALDDFVHALQRDPRLVEAYVHRARLYNDVLKAYLRAVDDYTRAIALRPDDALLRAERAHAYANLERFDDAMADYAKAIELAPDLPLFYAERGRTWYRIQDYPRALDDETHALALAPDYARAMYWRGRALLGLGKQAAAVQQLTAYVKARPLDADGFRARAEAWHALGRHDLAGEDENKAGYIQYLQLTRPVKPAPQE